MSVTPPPADRELALAFFGVATSGLSHELNNVLAIVNELSGLIGDMVAAAERAGPLDPARLRGVLTRLSAQLERGKEQVRLLNRFAHSVDGAPAALDARDAVALAVALAQRPARLRKVRLSAAPCPVPLPAVALPFDVLHLVYRCIGVAVGDAEPGSEVRASAVPEGGGARVVLELERCAAAPGAARAEALGEVVELARTRGCRLDTVLDPGQPGSVSLWWPGVAPVASATLPEVAAAGAGVSRPGEGGADVGRPSPARR